MATFFPLFAVVLFLRKPVYGAMVDLHRLLSVNDLAGNLGQSLIAVSGTFVALVLVVRVYNLERLSAELPGIKRPWKSTAWIDGSIILGFLTSGFAIAGMIADKQPSRSSGGWMMAAIATFLLSLVFLLPAGKALALPAAARRFLQAQFARMTVAHARDYAIDYRRAASAADAIHFAAANAYAGVLRTFRTGLQSRNEGLVLDILEKLAVHHLELLDRATSENERHWVVAAFLRINEGMLAACEAEQRGEVARRVAIMLGAWLVEAGRKPFDGAVLPWLLEDQLARRLATLADPEPANQVMRALVGLALDQLAKCQPIEPGQRRSSTGNVSLDETSLNHRFHEIAERYREFLRKIADVALETGRPETVREAAYSLTYLANEMVELPNLSDRQKERLLTWLLALEAESVCTKLIELGQAGASDIPHPWQFLVDKWASFPPEYQHVGFVTYTRVMMNAALAGHVPWNAWNQLRMWLGDFAEQPGNFPRDALHWGATTIEHVLDSASSEHKKGKLVGHYLNEIAQLLRWVMPKLQAGPHATDLLPRFEALRDRLVAFDKIVGGITTTEWKWPGRPDQREVRNIVQELMPPAGSDASPPTSN